jgi:hypothetical protein
LPDDGLVNATGTLATNGHVAFPGVDFQVEVFDPTPGAGVAAVKAGGLTMVGSADAGRIKSIG